MYDPTRPREPLSHLPANPPRQLPVLDQDDGQVPVFDLDAGLDADLRADVLQQQVHELEDQLRAVYASTAWRVSRPVRVLGDWKRRVERSRRLGSLVTKDRVLRAVRMLERGDAQGVVSLGREMVRYRTGLLEEQRGQRRPLAQQRWPDALPLITVVVPNYNYGRFLRDAVESIRQQTFSRIELIIVDAASSNEAEVAALQQVVGDLRDGEHFHQRAERHLLGCNRNFGVQRARGKYICCLDPDDMLAPTYLEVAAFLLEAEGFDVVGAVAQHFGERTDTWGLLPRPTLHDLVEANATPSSAVFRRDLWGASGGFHDTGLGSELVYEDWKFWVRVMALGARMYNIQAPLFLYRKHGGSQSSSVRISPREEQREVILAYNRDVLTPEAFERSERRAGTDFEVRNALVNLLPTQAQDNRPGVLVCLPFLPRAGAQRIVASVCQQLARDGFRVVLMTTIAQDQNTGSAREWFEGSTPEIYELPQLLPPLYWRDFLAYLIESKGIQLVWQIGSDFVYDNLQWIKSQHPRITVADCLYVLGIHTDKNRRLAEHIDEHVVENRELESWLLSRGEDPAHVHRIPNGVDAQVWAPRPVDPAAWQLIGAPSGKAVIGYASRLADEKAPDVFLDVAELLVDHRSAVFVMAGAGPLEQHVATRVRRRNLRDRVRLVGLVEDTGALMSTFDVLVLPSVLEGRPNIVLEAMAMGIPVVATRVGGVPELVQDNVTGYLVDAGDSETLAKHVRYLVDNPDERERMGREARNAAMAMHSLRRTQETYSGLFKDLVEGKSPHDAPGGPNQQQPR